LDSRQQTLRGHDQVDAQTAFGLVFEAATAVVEPAEAIRDIRVQVTKTVHQAPVFQAGHPLALFRQEAALAGFQPALGVVRTDTNVTVFRGNVHVTHHDQRLVAAELRFQQLLQIVVKTLLGREFGRVVTVFTLWEIAVHDGHRYAVGIGESAPDKASLSVFFITGKAFMQCDRCQAREQGDAVMALLPVVMHLVTQGLNFGQGELVVMDLGFLQPDHVRLVLLDQRGQLMGPGAQAVDVERDDLHGRQSWQNCDASRQVRRRPAWRFARWGADRLRGGVAPAWRVDHNLRVWSIPCGRGPFESRPGEINRYA